MKEIRAMRALLDRCLLSPKKQAGGGGREPPPEGCLAVYVGAARERFVVRTESVNHRLFRALLEEAEEARGPYGYAPDGPLELPACDAAAFARVVEAIKRDMAEERTTAAVGCGGIVWAVGHSAAHRTVAAAVIAGGRQDFCDVFRGDRVFDMLMIPQLSRHPDVCIAMLDATACN